MRLVQWVLAVALAVAAGRGWSGGRRSVGTTSRLRPSAGLLAAGVLSPLLVLPMLSSAADRAHRGRSAEACGAMVGIALLNLCALLPAVILVWYARTFAAAGGWPAALAAAGAVPAFGPVPNGPPAPLNPVFLKRAQWSAAFATGRPVPLPMSLWRVDVVVLLVLGFALTPLALGRWVVGRLEGVGLVVAYAAYLLATVVVSDATLLNILGG